MSFKSVELGHGDSGAKNINDPIVHFLISLLMSLMRKVQETIVSAVPPLAIKAIHVLAEQA